MSHFEGETSNTLHKWTILRWSWCNFWMSIHTSLSFFHSSLASVIQYTWIIEMAQINASTSSFFLESASKTTFSFPFCILFQSHNPTSLWPIFAAILKIVFVPKSVSDYHDQFLPWSVFPLGKFSISLVHAVLLTFPSHK